MHVSLHKLPAGAVDLALDVFVKVHDSGSIDVLHGQSELAPLAGSVTLIYPKKYIFFGPRNTLVRGADEFFDKLVSQYQIESIDVGQILVTPGMITSGEKARAIGKAQETQYLPLWLDFEHGWSLLRKKDCAALISALESIRSDIDRKPDLMKELDDICGFLLGCKVDEVILATDR